jgi:FkbH-like protein
VSDRFGDEGIVGATWVERGARVWRVLNLVLSCRVLGRGVELSVLDWVAGQARQANATTLAGHYVPSGRNGVAGDFFQRAGFRSTGDDGVFVLDLDGAPDLAPDWITLTGTEHGST